MILLDTHVLVRYAAADRRLGKHAAALIDRALRRTELSVSAISFWEVAMLMYKGKLRLNDSPMAFRALTLRQGIQERPIDGEVAIRSVELASLHADPADRIIAATAMMDGAMLVTSDTQLLSADLDGLRTQDASS